MIDPAGVIALDASHGAPLPVFKKLLIAGHSMKKLLTILFAISMPARAHESLAPHAHPHELSMLAGTDAVICALFALVLALIAYWRFGRAPRL